MEKNLDKSTIEIFDVLENLSKLIISRDTASLKNILDNDYTLTHITGYVQPREEWINEIEKERMKYYAINKVNRDIKVIGNIAEVKLQSIIDARIWGSRNTWRIQQIMKLKKTNDAWIILSSVASTF